MRTFDWQSEVTNLDEKAVALDCGERGEEGTDGR